jgi:hypothetical protein
VGPRVSCERRCLFTDTPLMARFLRSLAGSERAP